ncbi:ATP-binding cassette domain-containing protein [Nocardiopsis aegyptia]|uniref:ATP-binding cassette subfamily C protein n=1 Tax=Nocardiopsis aegyptia TaxID=220378 RepID=A0A7Z0JBH4_9ACTN|nr:ABC transporter ATP-binding protein [Nocardiopsis aegyptia]NYJ35837.1 ATP-binding cassette subfamily C protein [Nocardiopsis aegyptia]
MPSRRDDRTYTAFPRPGWPLLAGSLGLRWRALLRLAAWSMVESLPAALSGLVIARAIDGGFLAGDFRTGLLWLGLLFAVHGVGALATRFTLAATGSVVEPLRDDLLGAVVASAVHGDGVDRSIPDSAKVARVTEQVEEVRRTTGTLLSGARRFVFTLVATTVGLLALAPSVLAVALPPVLLAIVLFAALLGTLVRRQYAAVVANEAVARSAGEALAGSRDITASRSWEAVCADTAGDFRAERAADLAMARAVALRGALTSFGSYGPLLCALAAAPLLIGGADGLTVGALVGAISYLASNIEPVMRLLTEVLGGAGLVLVVSLRRLRDTCPEPSPSRVEDTPEAVGGSDASVEVDDVAFAYGGSGRPVLDGVRLRLRHGDHLAVVGPSGIGKSTLALLLAGLARPDRGVVRVGGADPADPDVRRTDLVCLIPQEAYVLTGTLRDNVGYLCEGAPDGHLLEALANVGAAELAERLGGLDAVVDPAALSNGQRQLVALARAYASPAPVVILDEATCHLAPSDERRAEEAFRARGGTLVVIAHRIDSARRAGTILLLDGSRPLAGTHEELLSASDLYTDLVGHGEVRLSRPVP